MARHYIGFTSKGPSVYRNVRTDTTGRPLVLLEESEQSRIELDFQSFLETGETVSSVTTSANNITVASANDTNSATLTLSGATGFGEVLVTVTFSTGDKWSEKIRVRNKRRYTVNEEITDYGEPVE